MAQQNTGTHTTTSSPPPKNKSRQGGKLMNLSSLPWAEGATCLGLVGCQKEESMGDGFDWDKYKMELNKNEGQARVID